MRFFSRAPRMNDHDRLLTLLRPDSPRAPTSCCGSVLVQVHKYESCVCRCQATCLLPGQIPEKVKKIVAALTPEENEAIVAELEAELSPENRAIREEIRVAHVENERVRGF